MSTVTINGYIVYRTERYWNDDERITFSPYEPGADSGKVLVREHSIEVEVPDDFDPRPGQIAALEAKKQEVRAAFAKSIRDIDERIQSLLALEAS